MSRSDDQRAFGLAFAVLGVVAAATVIVAGSLANTDGHRDGIIDATTGAWKAKYDEDTQQWLVWEVKE